MKLPSDLSPLPSVYSCSHLRVVFCVWVGLLLLTTGCLSTEHGNPEMDPKDKPSEPTRDASKTFPDATNTLPDTAVPSDDAGSDPFPDAGYAPSDSGTIQILDQCEHDVWRSPNDDRVKYKCIRYPGSLNEDAAVSEDAAGSNDTTEKWTCDCEQGQRTEIALEDESCDSAVERICGISLDERNFCEIDEIRCWPNPSQDDSWLCGCDVGRSAVPSSDTLAPESAPDCKQAAFRHCASECKSPLGACKPNVAEQIYECDCDYYPATRFMVASNCEVALARCNPSLGVFFANSFFCNNFAGSCDLSFETMRCQCLDGTEREVDVTTNPNYPELQNEDLCEPLWEICGDETEQRESWSCLAEPQQDRKCYISYNFNKGLYQCHCESESECGDEYDFYQGDYDKASCAQARDSCLEDDGQREPVEPEPC